MIGGAETPLTNEIIKISNEGYSRCNIASPGFAGGPCLGKDGILLDNNTTFSRLRPYHRSLSM